MTRLAIWLLTKLCKDKKQVAKLLMSTVGALPLHATITEAGGKIVINGVPLENDRANTYRVAAQQMLNNPAFRAVREQVLYLAVSQAIHKSLSYEQTQFGKAAIWFGEQEIELLRALAHEDYGNVV